MVQSLFFGIGQQQFAAEIIPIGRTYFAGNEKPQYLLRLSNNERSFTSIVYDFRDSKGIVVLDLVTDIFRQMMDYIPHSKAEKWAEVYGKNFSNRFAGRAMYLYQANLFNGFSQIMGSRRKAVETIITAYKNNGVTPLSYGLIQ